MKLIDAEKLVTLLVAWQSGFSSGNVHADAVKIGTLQRVIDLIVTAPCADAPTVDAVSVVRCKDCVRAKPLPDNGRMFFKDEILACERYGYCLLLGYSIVAPEDFCSSGIRKED